MTACLHCNKEFVKAANVQKYCSAVCRNEATSTRGPLREVCCTGCSVKFTTTNPNKEFCTNECRWTYSNNQRETSRTQFRSCVVCSKSFQPMQKTGPGRTWCSETCRHVMGGNPHRVARTLSGEPSDAAVVEATRQERRRRSLKQNFGITLERYEEMHEAQNGLCAICDKPEATKNNFDTGVRRLAVDHDHATGKIRALLCSSCNTLLGQANDSPALLGKAIEYLKSHSENTNEITQVKHQYAD